uniref:C2H2-type domain-containing protein n=1 Tax=Acrobeloides nanus TaxID=290746 RepID=A0A914C4U1_9BILA
MEMKSLETLIQTIVALDIRNKKNFGEERRYICAGCSRKIVGINPDDIEHEHICITTNSIEIKIDDEKYSEAETEVSDNMSEKSTNSYASSHRNHFNESLNGSSSSASRLNIKDGELIHDIAIKVPGTKNYKFISKNRQGYEYLYTRLEKDSYHCVDCFNIRKHFKKAKHINSYKQISAIKIKFDKITKNHIADGDVDKGHFCHDYIKNDYITIGAKRYLRSIAKEKEYGTACFSLPNQVVTESQVHQSKFYWIKKSNKSGKTQYECIGCRNLIYHLKKKTHLKYSIPFITLNMNKIVGWNPDFPKHDHICVSEGLGYTIKKKAPRVTARTLKRKPDKIRNCRTNAKKPLLSCLITNKVHEISEVDVTFSKKNNIEPMDVDNSTNVKFNRSLNRGLQTNNKKSSLEEGKMKEAVRKASNEWDSSDEEDDDNKERIQTFKDDFIDAFIESCNTPGSEILKLIIVYLHTSEDPKNDILFKNLHCKDISELINKHFIVWMSHIHNQRNIDSLFKFMSKNEQNWFNEYMLESQANMDQFSIMMLYHPVKNGIISFPYKIEPNDDVFHRINMVLNKYKAPENIEDIKKTNLHYRMDKYNKEVDKTLYEDSSLYTASENMVVIIGENEVAIKCYTWTINEYDMDIDSNSNAYLAEENTAIIIGENEVSIKCYNWTIDEYTMEVHKNLHEYSIQKENTAIIVGENEVFINCYKWTIESDIVDLNKMIREAVEILITDY